MVEGGARWHAKPRTLPCLPAAAGIGCAGVGGCSARAPSSWPCHMAFLRADHRSCGLGCQAAASPDDGCHAMAVQAPRLGEVCDVQHCALPTLAAHTEVEPQPVPARCVARTRALRWAAAAGRASDTMRGGTPSWQRPWPGHSRGGQRVRSQCHIVLVLADLVHILHVPGLKVAVKRQSSSHEKPARGTCPACALM